MWMLQQKPLPVIFPFSLEPCSGWVAALGTVLPLGAPSKHGSCQNPWVPALMFLQEACASCASLAERILPTPGQCWSCRSDPSNSHQNTILTVQQIISFAKQWDLWNSPVNILSLSCVTRGRTWGWGLLRRGRPCGNCLLDCHQHAVEGEGWDGLDEGSLVLGNSWWEK